MTGRKAIFLDRDGTLNKNTHYLIDFADFELMPDAVEAMRLFQDKGFRLFGVSNQSGIARGYFTAEAVDDLHEKIIAHLAGKDIRIEEIAYCPHHPEGVISAFAVECDCRKPKPGMIRRLQEKYGLDVAASFMVGDNRSDAEAGVNAGATGVWITGPLAGMAQQPSGPGRLDNPGNIKEFVSLIDFARNLKGSG